MGTGGSFSGGKNCFKREADHFILQCWFLDMSSSSGITGSIMGKERIAKTFHNSILFETFFDTVNI
jgi:hypothetical protein